MIAFTFDGRAMQAQPGDTLAAALVRNGVQLVGRSFKYHRPRGILSAGVEEPNALVTVGEGGRTEPNTRASDVFVYEGMVATSQNAWPSLKFDLGAVIGLFSKALPAGFYYKTFFGPAKLWLGYEWFIRRAAGLGNAPTLPDPDRFAQRGAFCDVLVIGGGPAGLAEALKAAEAGEKVILVEQDAVLAPSLRRDPQELTPAWAEVTAARIRELGGTVLTRTSAAGYWEHDLVTLTQLLVEPGQVPGQGPAQRLWHVRAGRVVLASGALERPLAFASNDLPGVMLSQAVRTYARRFGVVPGKRVVVATNNDDAYATAHALAELGAEIVAVLDSRPASAVPDLAGNLPLFTDARPIAARGGSGGVRALTARIGETEQTFATDLVAMSGGFTPTLHLFMQAGSTLGWDDTAQAFIPGTSRQNITAVGAAAQVAPIHDAEPLGDPKKSFIDFQNDVTLGDVDLAWAEGYRSVEHVKRYTTLGMATDQGKTGNMAALTRLARH
ncbi:MAG TPA: 2Fe-2S iron-sulfur cluster-binding protein, partial [Novosphingobium sp.]|nr:2Fe-2S iron-sulfur cluster-binding protein [Novosphingobium sp.]